MAEEIIFKNEIPKHDYFSLLILGQGRGGKLDPIKEVYDKPVQIELIVNGQQVFIQDFRDTLKEWSSRLERQYRERYENLITEAGVEMRAKEMLKERLKSLYTHLENLESVCEDKINFPDMGDN